MYEESDTLARGLGLQAIPEACKRILEINEISIEVDPVGMQAVEKMPVPRLILFIWAFVQAIKIFGCTGIPWTLTAAHCYTQRHFSEVLGQLLEPPS